MMSSSFSARFDYYVQFPHEDVADPESSLYKAVRALIECKHGHWFLVKSDEFALLCNRSGLECIRSAEPHLPGQAFPFDIE